LHAAEEEDREDRRGVAGQIVAGEDTQRDLDDADDERDDRDEEAEVGREAQRDLAERGDAVEREAQHLRERILGLAGKARIAIVLDAGLVEADPRNEPANEAVPLARALQHLHDAPAHQPEIARIDGDRDVREASHDPVERRRREYLEAALARAPPAGGVDDIVAGAEALDERADQLGRVLQVAVHQHDRVAARRVDAGGRRDLVAEVARERDDPQVRVAFEPVEQEPARGIAAAVVDGDHFVRRRRIR